MGNINYCEDLFKSIPDYRKIDLLMYFIKNDVDFLQEYGFLKSDIERLSLDFKNIISEKNEKYCSYDKNEEGSVLEKILNE